MVTNQKISDVKYVCVANRDRDSYQVPRALSESSQLEVHVTDAYAGAAWWCRSQRFEHRSAEGLPPSKVKASLRAVGVQTLPLRASTKFTLTDSFLEHRAAAAVSTSDAGFFGYSGYARASLEACHVLGRRSVLFVYHPHPRVTNRLLEQDRESFPTLAWSPESDLDVVLARPRSQRLDDELALADRVVCASSFSARSLGGQVSPLVIPYGSAASVSSLGPDRVSDAQVEFLFVGQGVQRKGVHHLLEAWGRAAPASSRLTVVTATCDPALEARLQAAHGVRHLKRQDKRALEELYRSSDVFVLPSLVEGFGLVLLEAARHGCWLIGSSNTGLPDLLRGGVELGEVYPAGDVDLLAAALLRASFRGDELRESRESVGFRAASWSWERFREGIKAAATFT
jgi:glycosyltransferase involved in cell wall biosynthesis